MGGEKENEERDWEVLSVMPYGQKVQGEKYKETVRPPLKAPFFLFFYPISPFLLFGNTLYIFHLRAYLCFQFIFISTFSPPFLFPFNLI